MTSETHTKGPWEVDWERTDGGAPIVVGTSWLGSERVVAKVCFYNGSEDPEVKANARLIAAAPDMLEVFLDFVGKVERGEARSKRTYSAMKKILAGIKPDMEADT